MNIIIPQFINTFFDQLQLSPKHIQLLSKSQDGQNLCMQAVNTGDPRKKWHLKNLPNFQFQWFEPLQKCP